MHFKTNFTESTKECFNNRYRFNSEDYYRSGIVETSVAKNSFSPDYPHPDDHAKHVTDTGFSLITKPLSRCTHDLKAC